MTISGRSNDDDVPTDIICDMEKITGTNADEEPVTMIDHRMHMKLQK